MRPNGNLRTSRERAKQHAAEGNEKKPAELSLRPRERGQFLLSTATSRAVRLVGCVVAGAFPRATSGVVLFSLPLAFFPPSIWFCAAECRDFVGRVGRPTACATPATYAGLVSIPVECCGRVRSRVCASVVRHVGSRLQEVSYRATTAGNFAVGLSRSGCFDVRCDRGLGLKCLGASTGKGVASSVPILPGVRRPDVGWTSSGEDDHFSPREMCRE